MPNNNRMRPTLKISGSEDSRDPRVRRSEVGPVCSRWYSHKRNQMEFISDMAGPEIEYTRVCIVYHQIPNSLKLNI